MAAYQVGGRGPFRIGPKRLPGGVEIGRISTGTKDKRLADAMERCVDELAVQGWGDLVARLGSDLRLPDLYAAKILGPGELQRLRERKTIPPLIEVLYKAERFIQDPRARHGVGELRTYLEELGALGETFAWLQDPANLNDLYAHALEESGKPPNSLRRSLHRAVAEILSHELGRGKMLGIMADVTKPSADDERDVDLTPKEIGKLLEALDEEARPVAELGLLSGIDLTPILRIRPRDYDADAGDVAVDDRKAESRKRRIALSSAAESIIRRHAAGRDESEPIFGLTRWAFRHRFDTAKKTAGLPELRFKDLRGVFATNYLRAGGSPKELMHILGHSSMTMTLRYVRRLPVGKRVEMEAAAEKMGLSMKQRLRVERGGAE